MPLQNHTVAHHCSHPLSTFRHRVCQLNSTQLKHQQVTEFNPVRVGFKGMDDIWVRDCLNVGVDPVGLVAAIKARFREAGGVIREHTELKKVAVFPDGVRLTVAAGTEIATVVMVILPTCSCVGICLGKRTIYGYIKTHHHTTRR